MPVSFPRNLGGITMGKAKGSFGGIEMHFGSQWNVFPDWKKIAWEPMECLSKKFKVDLPCLITGFMLPSRVALVTGRPPESIPALGCRGRVRGRSSNLKLLFFLVYLD